MPVTERYFRQENQYAVIHLPIRPNGFGVLYIGGNTHYVDEEQSCLLQHFDKRKLLSVLTEEGYTVFTSNLYGKNWGSDDAVELAEVLYHSVMRKEILNPSIHIIGEGTGALVVCKLLAHLKEKVRSICLLNPSLNLKNELDLERENKLFYKRTVHEILKAYKTTDIYYAIGRTCYFYETISPIKIYSSTRNHFKWKKDIRLLEEERNRNNLPISILISLEEKKYECGKNLVKFLKKYQTVL
ncbi:alpha/beta hydrolase [Gottfriedia solisilvae]|uniref:Hydrolase n=1 Tax=Gottfriedia solisilvae TaxID=1516104 RepID=A0A8J3ALM3_9BACI|nr:alpha/beta hydrolase [Gottfriedia solisilvae]GGI14994.1 hydrolase [Gottfriedia solisilvae]